MSLVLAKVKYVVNAASIKSLEDAFLTLRLSCYNQIRGRTKLNPKPRLRNPTWFIKKQIAEREELVTPENESFIKEVIEDKYNNESVSQKDISTNIIWTPRLQRTGVIARKLGSYPMWMKDGKITSTTLLQVLDNHVIRYYPPEQYDPPRKRIEKVYNKKGCLLIGADPGDPSQFTKEYCGLFRDSGVIPKKVLARFFVSPDAALPLGTLINAMHFQVGNVVDVRGKTIDRGFQGVMKRHGFKGMPASHGVTKTHRRGGNIGGGGEKGRVWPGTKMPGHMGNRYRINRGQKILRINTKYNIIYVGGQHIPGETNSIVYIYDTKLPLRKPTKPLPFPTFVGDIDESVPENLYDESMHDFSQSSILYDENE
nr:39S ribosomal protein L3, mitochondrial [Leptinotarsa decemlineata]